MDLHEFNASVLGAVGIVDENGKGHLSRVLSPATTAPFMIGSKRVVLPTAENLRSAESNTIVYHPLSENITRSESDMIKSLRDQIMFKLTVTAVQLISELGRVAATESEHGLLDKASLKYLKQVPDMDVRTYEFMKKVMVRIGPEPEKRLISISLRKGSTDGVLRAAKFKFPVLDELLSNDKDLLGVKYPSKKARATVTALFEFVLGDEDTRAGYDYGSKNMTAPYFHALMIGFSQIAGHLNDIIKKHRKLLGKVIDDDGIETSHWLADDLHIDLDWLDSMDDLANLRRKVPPQEGNEGRVIVASPTESAKVVEKLSTRLAPGIRESTESAETMDVPFDMTPRKGANPIDRDRDQRRGEEAPLVRAKSLDDYLSGGSRRDDRDDRSSRFSNRDDRYDRGGRDDRYGRDDRSSRWGGRDDRGSFSGRDDRGGRRFNLGLESDYDQDRDSRWGGREERSRGRGFGEGRIVDSPRTRF